MRLDPDLPPGPFGLSEDHHDLDTDWHTHRRSQLLYATRGAMRLQLRHRVAILPPDRAAWIPGGSPHRVRCGRPVHLRTVYFDGGGGPLAIFEAKPLLREMAIEACRWGSHPPPGARPFFEAFAWLIETWRSVPLPVDLPTPSTPGLRDALDRLLDRLGAPWQVEDAARLSGMSPRSLQRRMQDEAGMTFSAWLQRARMQRAVELLADPSLQIGEIALRVGYQSPAAFSRVFRAHLGVSPRDWR